MQTCLANFKKGKTKDLIVSVLTALDRLLEESKDVKSRSQWRDAKDLYATIMPQKAFGARLEITLQNPDLEDLVLAYEVVKDLAKAMVGLFNMLKAVWQCGMV